MLQSSERDSDRGNGDASSWAKSRPTNKSPRTRDRAIPTGPESDRMKESIDKTSSGLIAPPPVPGAAGAIARPKEAPKLRR